MADTDNDTTQQPGGEPEEEIVILEQPPEDKPAQQAHDDEDDDHDERLSGSQDDYDDDVAGESPGRRRRLKRRELQRRARDNAQHEISLLRQQNEAMMQRLLSLEGSAVQSTEQGYQSSYQQAMQEVRTAEQVIARATEAGNGDDVVAAMRIRDAALARAQQVEQGYQQLQAYKQQQAAPPAPSTPQLDPDTQRYASEWLQANPWYDPRGADEDSAIATAIEASMKAQGYDSSTRAYWEELTRRVSAKIGGGEAVKGDTPAPRRGPPPQGGGREHAPATTRREIYVTPERKAAMVEAGIWDDIPRRNQMLKKYAEYDRSNSASR